MECRNLLVDICGCAVKTVESVLCGLTQEDLVWRPNPESNSIGWITWHLARVLDKLVSPIIGEEQLWLQDRWHTEFNRSPDPDDTGWGHTLEQVGAFKCPNPQILLDYHRSVIKRLNHCLESLTVSDLDREVSDSWSKFCPTIASRLVIAFDELVQHAGQVAYIRGFRQGKGWQ